MRNEELMYVLLCKTLLFNKSFSIEKHTSIINY